MDEFGNFESFCVSNQETTVPTLNSDIIVPKDIFVSDGGTSYGIQNNTFEPIINNCSVFFHNKKGEKVGEFDFNASPATFKGNVDESAQIFVDNILKIWNLKKE